MKKSLLLNLLVAPLIFSGCAFDGFFKKSNVETSSIKENNNSNSDDINNNQTPSPTTNTDTNSGDNTKPSGDESQTTPEEIVVNSIISSVLFKQSDITVAVGAKSSTPLLDIEYSEGTTIDDVDWEWTIKDETIGEVDAAGRVTGLNKGKTFLTFTIVSKKDAKDTKTIELPVFVINDQSDLVKKWTKVTGDNFIQEKDQIIIACSQESKAVITNDNTGHVLYTTNITLNSDKSEITNIGSAEKFCVYRDWKGRDGYNFELENEQFLGTSNTKNVSFFDSAKSSQTVWDVKWDSEQNCIDMRSATNIDGWMMYNKQIDKFTTYQSNEQDGKMYVVSLYRLDVSVNID